VKVFTRRGHDWTNRFKKIADEAWHIAAGSAIIDGEVVVPPENGTTDFSVLQNELKGKSNKIVMVAFDLLYLNGYDLRKLPLIERKTHLKKIIDGEVVVPAANGSTDFSVLQNEFRGTSTRIVLIAFDLLYLNGRDLRKLPLFEPKAELKKLIAGTDVQFSESFEIEGREMFGHACKLRLEGVVSKVRDSMYASGRGNNWVKKTCAQRETLTIAGYAIHKGKWDGIYVGRRKGADLIYAGKVHHGFDRNQRQTFRSN